MNTQATVPTVTVMVLQALFACPFFGWLFQYMNVLDMSLYDVSRFCIAEQSTREHLRPFYGVYEDRMWKASF